jgi:hypothetical protein
MILFLYNCELHIKFCSHLKAHKNWIICENYTPNGVVVVVVVEPTKAATKVVVVNKEE